MSIRVVLADDHPALIVGVRTVLEASGTMTVVAEAHTPDELIETLKRVECDLVVMDYSMPNDDEREGRDGLYLLREVRNMHPALPIVILTMLRTAALIESVIDAGANGVLCKRDPIEQLAEMLNLVMSGHVLIRPRSLDVGGSEIAHFPFRREGDRPLLALLSPRETEVLRMLIVGRSLREVAASLNRSAKTISNQKRSAMQKLGLSSDIDLARFAIDCGLG